MDQLLIDSSFVFLLIGVAGLMMASSRVQYDLVAVIVIVSLILSGILTPDEALSGFGSSVVIMVAALMIVGEMLDRTGVAHAIGDQIIKFGGTSENRLVVVLMVTAAVLGCVMSSTAVVAIFLPIVIRASAATGFSRSRLLLPMSYAALISGMLTLIATPPNLVVSDTLSEAGYEGLGFFSFFLIGVVILLVAIVYTLVSSKFLLGKATEAEIQGSGSKAVAGNKSAIDLLEAYQLLDKFYLVIVSSRPGKDLEDLFSNIDARIIARRRPSKRASGADAFFSEMDLNVGDRLLVCGSAAEVAKLDQLSVFTLVGVIHEDTEEWKNAVGIADILIHPDAGAINRTVRDLKFRNTFGLDVIGAIRGETAMEAPLDTKLKAGDRLMVIGAWDGIDALIDQNHDFVLLNLPAERQATPPAHNKYFTALGILALMVILSVSGVVPVVVAVMLAAAAAIVFKTISADRAYGAVNWGSIVLVAGMLPLADALQSTGGADIVIDGLFALAGDSSPRVMMGLLFAMTAGLGLVLSNTASAVLVAPIAILSAEALGVSPYPLAICVLIAASAAFSTPVSTPVVTLVVSPGGYKFSDFLKVGIPLTIVTGAITVVLAPLVFPL